jgi:hypothetical protein
VETTPTVLTVVVVIAVACGGPIATDDNQLRADVVYCENAVAHAKSCCAGIAVPSQACTFHEASGKERCEGCGVTGTVTVDEHRYPVLTVQASQDLLSQTCDDIATQNGGCPRLAEVLASDNFVDNGSNDCHATGAAP